jgi:hypothetical protein
MPDENGKDISLASDVSIAFGYSTIAMGLRKEGSSNLSL